MMPMITVSTGRILVSGVSRALEPWVISTNSPSPAPTVSTATNERPVVDQAVAGLRIEPVRLDDQQLVADHRADLFAWRPASR